MKTLLVAVALAVVGCTDDPGPQFDIEPCNYRDGTCQRACNSQAAMGPLTGPRCANAYTYWNGDRIGPDPCPVTFEWNGLSGCCQGITIGQDSGDADVYFLQCE